LPDYIGKYIKLEQTQPEYNIRELAAKWANGTITSEEKIYYEKWYAAFNDAETTVYDSKIASSAELGQKILNGLQNRIEQNEKPVRRTIAPIRWISIAASFLLVISIGIYFSAPKRSSLQDGRNKAIVPGGNMATLHLANGRNIVLNNAANGALVRLGDDSVTKDAGTISYAALKAASSLDQQYDTLSIPRGGTYQLTLADGSRIWLNSSSAIRFPESFSGKERRVELLYGEAYFEISHHADQPFRVAAQSQTVEVLGTHFNISSYMDEPSIKTTLLEGSVKVSAYHSFTVIKPGQQAIAGNNQISVSEVNTEEAVAWKNGYFRFNGEKIESVMRKLSRWYNIEVRYEGVPPDEEYHAAISRYRDINEVLKELEYSKSVHFKVEGRRVTVMP
jgi:transmembrane sensor